MICLFLKSGSGASKRVMGKIHQRFKWGRVQYNFSQHNENNNPKKETNESEPKANEYQKNFEKLQEKISNNKSDSQIKTESVKNLFVNAKRYVDGGIESLFKKKPEAGGAQASNETKEEKSNINNKPNSESNTKKAEANDQVKAEKKEEKKEPKTDEKKAGQTKEENNQTDSTKKTAEEQPKQAKVEKKPKMDVLKEKLPRVHKVVSIAKYAWDLTFPDEKYKAKFEKNKEQWAEQKKEADRIANLTEEELKKMEEQVPEWKKNSLVQTSGPVEKEGIRDKIKNKVRVKFNQTEFAKNIYTSDKYKEFEAFKREMAQFKEDVKDQVENSQSRVVQTSLNLYSKAANESTVAKAVREMRKIQPDFDIWELEDDAKGIFEAAYTTFLQGNLELLEKMCGEMALGYFKVLLKKREVEKSEPKYKYLWNIERAFFSGATIPEKRLPVFMFTIQTQEIYCNISTVDKRIVDGDDERLMRYEFSFALTPHSSPDVEAVGHTWEIIEIQPKEVLKLLV